MSLPVTEDTPPDMLAGSMDLNVVLPNGKNVKMSIQRSTPMMDLLVQATTAHRLSPGNYSIQAMGDRGVLPYKPSTPIGTLDAFKIKIVDKKLNSHKKAPQVPQAFLNTFRLQVNLPRSQLFVARVIPDITLSEVLRHVCTEKNLDINKYEFRNPAKPDELLDLEKTLGNYKIQELSLVNKNKRICGGLSAADILHVKSSMLRQNSVCDSSLSSGSLGSRSTSPVPVNLPRVPPQPPVRKKRRPAPKPPQITENESKEETKTSRSGLISHSRESSDSSGYHEASVLSESPTHGGPLGRSESSSPPDTLPRHGKLLPSQSFTNLSIIQPAPRTRLASSVSNASLNSSGASRKKRAAPPPPIAAYHASEEKMKSSTLPTSRAEERIISNVPFVSVENGDIPAVEGAKVETVENSVEINTKVDSEIVVKPVPKPRTMPSENPKEREEKVSIIRSQTESAILNDETSTEPSPENKSSSSENLKIVKSDPKMATDEDCKFASNSSCLERWQKFDSLACLNEDEAKATKTAWLLGDSEPSENITPTEEHDSLNWQYQLPPPPTDFRDSHSPICTELGTVTIMPDMYKEEVTYAKEPEGTKIKDCLPREEEEEVRTPQKKMAVMNELTNVLSSDGWKAKKSSSVTNLYASDETNNRKASGLSYSRSFTNDLPKALKLPTYETYGVENNRDNNYEKEIRYKNNRNLEKSLSMECIQSRTVDDHGRAEECFRRPVAPVQKKLKVAKRSASTMGYNLAPQRKSDSDLNCNGDSDNIDDLLRQHFLDFLKEKKLTNDLKMKSLDVIRHILPQINGTEKLEAKEPVPKSTVKVTDFVKKSSVQEKEVKENVVIIENKEYVKEAEVRTKELEVKKADPVKRFSYHAPPSINFATWGERPKTQVLIKDEDYVTEVAMKIEKKPAEAPKPVIQKKPSTLQFKKPGVKSHYEMFSALPKKKEVTPLTLIQMEEEEKKKRKAEAEEEERKKRTEKERMKWVEEAREPSRVPVVCAVELKKEFREQQQKGVVSEVTIKPEPVPPHSVSIYVNGSQRAETAKPVVSATKPFVSTFPIQKRNPIMPVVKGFRTAEDQHFQSHVNINKVCNFNSHLGDQVAVESNESVPKSQNSKHITEVCLQPPPPPPPIFGPVNLRPVSARKIQPKAESADPRGQLMAEIRNFRGFNLQKLKTAQ